MAQSVGVDVEPDPKSEPPEHALQGCGGQRLPSPLEEEMVGRALRADAVDVPVELLAQPIADRRSPELRPLAAADLQEARLAVVLEVVDLEGAELRDPHPGPH